MKFIHFSDLHLGIQRGPINKDTRIHERILDFMDVLESTIEFAETEDVDLAIFSGDAFHVSSPNQTYLNMFAKAIERLARQCVVVMVIGNHDMPGPTHKPSSVDIFGSVKADNIIIGNNPKVYKVETKSGMVQVAVMPYPLKQWVLNWANVSANKVDTGKEIGNIIKKLGDEIDEELPSILAAHLTVSSAKYASGQTLTFEGKDAIVDIESLTWPWDYVALGHIHIHQVLCDEPPVIYAGSLERVDFGDEGHPKGFIFGNIDDDVSWEFIEVDAREYVTISVDVSELKNKYMQKVLDTISKYDVTDAVVRINIKVKDFGKILNTSEIHDALMDAGAFFIQSINVKPIELISTPRLDLENPIQSYSPIDLVDIYFEEQGFDDDEIDDLLDLAEDIIEEVENG